MADELSLDLLGWDELLQRINELEQGSGPFTAMIRTTMQTALDLLEQAIVDRTPVNTGLLRGSIANVIYGQPPVIEGMVATPISYGLPVEHGRAPGKMPPVDAIQAWVHRKQLVPARNEKQERGVAWAIARTIAVRGTEGAHMFEYGFEAATPKIFESFEQLRDDIITGLASD